MKKYGYSDNKPAVTKRLNRIEGQVRGVNRMVEEDKYCIDILTQIAAIQSALDNVALELLTEHTKHCLNSENTTQKERTQKVEELVTAVSRML